MNVLKRLGLCATAVLALSAQSPAPDQVIATPLKAPRHLEYTFTASYYQSGERHTDAFSAGGEGSEGSGVVSSFGSNGRRGTIAADVVAVTSNGGLVIQIHEVEENAVRPSQTFSCVVMSDARMNCSDLARSSSNVAAVEGPSESEVLLLGFLGRNFIDPSKLDANNGWGYSYDSSTAAVSATFKMTDGGDGKPVTVTEHKKFSPHNQNAGTATEEVSIAYDRTLSVPDTIHDERHDMWGNGQLTTTIDLKIAKDSFAAP